MRCTVYARDFVDVGPGQVKLSRVAQYPVLPGVSDDQAPTQHHSTLLLHTEQSWALQGGSAAVDPSAMIEECLLHREVVALPSSSSLVFPLVDTGVLVGLLVVELDSHGAGDGAAAAAGVEALGLAGAEAGGHAGRAHRGLTDEELRCLRLAVPLLSKACGMDARSAWQLAQTSLSAAAARGLLREVQRPLSTLNTFGAILAPRLRDGEPDRDIANGILTQGRRLQDLMWQLEDALHGPGEDGAPHPGDFASQGGSMGGGFGMGGMGGGQALQAPPFRSPGALPRDPSPAVQELLQLPAARRPAALPPTAAAAQASQAAAAASAVTAAAPVAVTAAAEGPVGSGLAGAPEASPLSSSSSATASLDGGPGPAPVSPGRVTFVDRTGSEKTLSGAPVGASLDPSSGAFTIRQPARPRPVDARPFAPPPPPGAAMATIDVEMEGASSRPAASGPNASSNGDARAAAAPGSGAELALAERRPAEVVPHAAGASAKGGHISASFLSPVIGISTNVVSAVAAVLIAAYKLATVSGIGFIVNSPLNSVLPRRREPGSGSGKKGGDGASSRRASAGAAAEVAAAGVAAAAGGASAPRLIPRPMRPLLVGVPAPLVQRVVGGMLDICLQSTPRGGQVCVSARQDGSGVGLTILHTGRMDLQRLHVRTRPPALATAAAAGSPGRTAAAGASALAAAWTGGGSGSAGGGAQSGSGVLSVEMAQELAQQAGGHLTVSYPTNMVNARSGSLDVGTSVEIWLPGPAA
ncbi:hypothetical protein HYH03_003229 [Edaphochlamys debaryana]|uniref:GAF domain-containing protein n=1 Tax=Edaphochlamys debaryana TaxID=47281 RepID=A0A836C4R4_9CHLO|nr:hypothetical protein HYH03_003229 [Edaphochlamys debaryana]|eukprot:KAG2499044.1 hypothetical protein HYH03_003229 [Edaphochlamys debaryana]